MHAIYFIGVASMTKQNIQMEDQQWWQIDHKDEIGLMLAGWLGQQQRSLLTILPINKTSEVKGKK
jgi:hypothetical protein